MVTFLSLLILRESKTALEKYVLIEWIRFEIPDTAQIVIQSTHSFNLSGQSWISPHPVIIIFNNLALLH